MPRIFLTSMYALHIGSRWYTSDLHIATSDVSAFVPPQQKGFCPSIEEMGIQCVARWSQPGSHMICCELLPYQVLLRVQRDGNHCQLDWLWCCSWEVADSCSPNVVPCDFHLFGLLKKHLAGKWFGIGADTKQAATSWLQILDTDPSYAAL